MVERLSTCEAMQAFLVMAQRGDSAAYHLGDLPRDRLQDRELARLADGLFRLSEGCEHIKCDNSYERAPGTGALALMQKRVRAADLQPCNEYRVLLHRPCTVEEISRAFATTKAPSRRMEAGAP